MLVFLEDISQTQSEWSHNFILTCINNILKILSQSLLATIVGTVKFDVSIAIFFMISFLLLFYELLHLFFQFWPFIHWVDYTFYLFVYLFIFGCSGSLLLHRLFSSRGEWGLLPSCTWASHCSGFSCCIAWALGPQGFSSCDSWAPEHRLNSSEINI